MLSSAVQIVPVLTLFGRVGAGLTAVLRGNAGAAAEHYAALLPHKGQWAVYTSVDRTLGLLARATGQTDAARAHYDNALAFCRKAGYHPELGWVCHDYADMLLSRGRGAPDRANVASLLDEGSAIATRLGMKPLLARVAALHGKHLTGRGDRPVYPDGLTDREVEVLRLIAAGKSNAEIGDALIISENTVARHVSNIFVKTGVANRVAAATYAMRHGLVSPA